MGSEEAGTGGLARYALPRARAGESVGLLGGSFDPAHEGHAHITREALRRFGLDQVWWVVSPGNPLKAKGPATLAHRMARARAVMDHPRVTVTDIETRIGTRYTAQTLRRLRRLYPGVRFVWLMGADNLAQLHRWQDWQQIMESVPVGVLARPGQRISARASKAARIYRHAKLPARAARALAAGQPPRWCFVNVPMIDMSSTRIRRTGGWTRQGSEIVMPARL
ncbi:nicotinate-nucleotide adenylyltransferase [Lutimaribacter sp. EGI FJ00015]|uniref:Nicotinate-nucleotide adenylyltransferase n=1 Tax=Lutimaribacter degradans TaxID=2945989 RepID=A0ACC5ZUB6_9RHOB|nr:nicotinate-nucleotide adenylyltransferase [Lutimaribacter sp. EGI FJ00013]MCM2561720.1 nicotinate-nucleotide adenylyltransferase [Lutimaribacter sp. EGI FJ00013]MCO0612567.1 nicotinate-nucleotide adenylyltransferase [Lutimaribacter sp. EGI FJ00015]MCO0635226.1 nicotinate-nucleotide adenylyltransferase [Lutimaribacter sp. EGI FJ00014]